MSRPVGVFQDAGTGLGALLKQGVLSLLMPAELSENMEGVEFEPVQLQSKGGEEGGREGGRDGKGRR